MIFKIFYWLGMLIESIFRAPFQRGRSAAARTDQRISMTEKSLLALLALGGFVFPFIYTATRWLDFANYHLPEWLGWLGVLLEAVAVYLFARAHRDLKTNWSPSLEIYAGHELVTNGIYRVIRHPMYASQWVMATAQILLLQNWIAGLSGLLVWIPFYFLRVRQEEKMMLETFGEPYRDYLRRTGAVFPKF